MRYMYHDGVIHQLVNSLHTHTVMMMMMISEYYVANIKKEDILCIMHTQAEGMCDILLPSFDK